MAISSRVTKLEMDTSRLKQNLHVKDQVIVELEDEVSGLQTAYNKIELRLKIMREDNANLLKERDSLASTANKLGRDLAKLETFKKQLIQSLNGENSPLADTVDIGTYNQPFFQGHSTNVSKNAGQSFSMLPNRTPSVTPMGTPKVMSTSVSPRRYSAADSPQRTSGNISPTAQSEGSVSSWYPSSQQSSGTRTPTLGCPFPAALLELTERSSFVKSGIVYHWSNSGHFWLTLKNLMHKDNLVRRL